MTGSGSSLTCTLEDGSRVFLHRAVRDKEAPIEASIKPGRLLSKTIDDLRREASDSKIAALTAQAQRTLDGRSEDDEFEVSGEREGIEHTNMGLWVDKYAPREFSQLLSAEKTNRDVLVALKQWDKFVFKKRDSASSGTGGAESEFKYIHC
jgi:hypothetical protein